MTSWAINQVSIYFILVEYDYNTEPRAIIYKKYNQSIKN